MSRSVVVRLVASFWLLSCGCEAAQCTQMRECCAAIASEEWVGEACGPIATNIQNADSCASVMSAIDAAATDRGAVLPAVCK